MAGPWEDFGGTAVTEAGPWAEFQQAQPLDPEKASDLERQVLGLGPKREASVADQVPVLNEVNRGYEKVAKLVKTPAPESTGPQRPSEQFTNLFNQGMGAMIPDTIPEAVAGAATGWGLGKVMSPAMSMLTSAFRAVRPLKKEVASEALAKLLPEDALKAQQWYKAADEMPPMQRDVGPAMRPGKMTQAEISHRMAANRAQTFPEMQEYLETLKKDQGALFRSGRTAAAHKVDDQIKQFEESIEQSFPGFKEAQKGYAQLKQTGRLQELTDAKDPLKAFEADLAKGRVRGTEGETLVQGGKATRYLKPDDVEEVRSIMQKLGKEPGENIWRTMLEGRATGAMVGGALGYGHSGTQGAAAGALAGIAGPKGINALIAASLKHPTARAFLKRSLENGGIANPHFWQSLGALGTRLGFEATND